MGGYTAMSVRAPDLRAEAIAINAEPWDPLPGMEKRRCPVCAYLYASQPERAEQRCHTCVVRGREVPGYAEAGVNDDPPT